MPHHDEPAVYVALLGSTTASAAEKVPFAHREHAEAVVTQWAQDHHDRPAVVEEWPGQRWQQFGPGGLSAVRRTVPARVRVFSMGPKSWAPDGRELVTWISDLEGWRWVWDFETDSYTDRPALARVEHRPGPSALTQASARGTDETAVREAFARACAEAQRTCGESPDRDLWETARGGRQSTPSATPRTPAELVAAHGPIIGRILRRPVPADTAPSDFADLIRNAAEATDRRSAAAADPFPNTAGRDLADAEGYLREALDLADGDREKDVLLTYVHNHLGRVERSGE
ncbi:hypothetical protein ACFWA9_10180 [Kitasatospora sp. NPDC059973]|uniref:hypothetical protein n=1 Tax=Kitasatospora sp. NPDC059973 TaxID=3347020 RepID=UPI0036788AFC